MDQAMDLQLALSRTPLPSHTERGKEGANSFPF